ncbi:MAG: DNA polymerase III subunit gamma/tau [Microbacterium sp.]
MSRADDAFAWDGDNDPTLDTGAEHPDEAVAPPVPEAVGGAEPAPAESAGEPEPAADVADEETEESAGEEPAGDDAEPRRMGDVALVALGVLGGVYALWTAGWIATAARMRPLSPDAMLTASLALAIAAPIVWFLTSWILTKRHLPWVRFTTLVAGIVVLVPWPFVMLGTVGL